MTFDDPDFVTGSRDVTYYVRAIQEPTMAIDAGGLRCTYNDKGECVKTNPCYGDYRTPFDDDCLSPNRNAPGLRRSTSASSEKHEHPAAATATGMRAVRSSQLEHVHSEATRSGAPASHAFVAIRASTRPPLLLGIGAAVGIVLAAIGLVGAGSRSSRGISNGVVARVNGTAITTDDYQRVLSALAQDRRDGLTAEDRRVVLDRLIDEELLVQRALELGYARQDTRVRKDLTSAVIDSVIGEHENMQASDTDLQAFYESHRDFFTRPGRVRVRQIWCRAVTAGDAPGALERAKDAAQRLRAGDDFAAVRGALGDTPVAPLPDALLPVTKLGDYIGPTAVRTVLSLQAGAVSDPVRSNTGYHVLQVVERLPDEAPAFTDIKPQVEMEYRRRGTEDALRHYLDDLRSRAQVEVSSKLP